MLNQITDSLFISVNTITIPSDAIWFSLVFFSTFFVIYLFNQLVAENDIKEANDNTINLNLGLQKDIIQIKKKNPSVLQQHTREK